MQKRKIFGRILPSILSVVLLLHTLTACEMNSLVPGDKDSGNQSVSENDENSEKSNPADSSDKPTSAPLVFHPLTGLSCSESAANIRPMAFMLGNTDAALPQYGTSYADILVEAPMQDGSTKLLLVTTRYAEIPKIGSIRASTDYCRDIAAFFGAALVHAGTADGSVGTDISGNNIVSTVKNSGAFYKEQGRLSPHNIFTTGTLFQNTLRQTGINTLADAATPVFRFAKDSETLSLSGKIATHVGIQYSSTQRTDFRYNAKTGLYTRYANGVAQKDTLNDKLLTAQNVLILYCDSTLSETAESATLSLSMESGSGVYAVDGSYISVLWHKDDDGQLILSRIDGSELVVYPGVTHIELVKSSNKSGVTFDCN